MFYAFESCKILEIIEARLVVAEEWEGLNGTNNIYCQSVVVMQEYLLLSIAG
jgi:hypothetical protein